VVSQQPFLFSAPVRAPTPLRARVCESVRASRVRAKSAKTQRARARPSKPTPAPAASRRPKEMRRRRRQNMGTHATWRSRAIMRVREAIRSGVRAPETRAKSIPTRGTRLASAFLHEPTHAGASRFFSLPYVRQAQKKRLPKDNNRGLPFFCGVRVLFDLDGTARYNEDKWRGCARTRKERSREQVHAHPRSHQNTHPAFSAPSRRANRQTSRLRRQRALQQR
jgi:hypothetical protein